TPAATCPRPPRPWTSAPSTPPPASYSATSPSTQTGTTSPPDTRPDPRPEPGANPSTPNPDVGSGCPRCLETSHQCPRQDSNLRSRLRRGLLCTPLTSANEFPRTMIGGLSGAGSLIAALVLAGRRWVALLRAQQHRALQQY